MKTAKSHPILIIEPDVQFREELYNFLLSDGYEHVTATDMLTNVLEQICHVAYDVILLDAGVPWGSALQVADSLATLSPTTKIILMINAADQDAWQQCAAQVIGVHFLLKMTFAHNVLYLLADCA